MSDIKWYSPDKPTPREQCPCFDFVSLAERGSYLVCPICFWEDDGQDITEIDVPSGSNRGLTLREGRDNFEKVGAFHTEMVEHVLAPELRISFKHRPRENPE